MISSIIREMVDWGFIFAARKARKSYTRPEREANDDDGFAYWFKANGG